MRVSEKLRLLERETRDLRFHRETKEEAERTVLAALPALVAVVEAAEEIVRRERRSEYTSIYAAPVEFKNVVLGPLTTLDETLGRLS